MSAFGVRLSAHADFEVFPRHVAFARVADVSHRLAIEDPHRSLYDMHTGHFRERDATGVAGIAFDKIIHTGAGAMDEFEIHTADDAGTVSDSLADIFEHRIPEHTDGKAGAIRRTEKLLARGRGNMPFAGAHNVYRDDVTLDERLDELVVEGGVVQLRRIHDI